MTVWRKTGGRMQVLWRAPAHTGNLFVADDGRSLVEFYPEANLLDPAAGPATLVMIFHRPGMVPVVVTLGELIRDPGLIPRTVSHRHWARTYEYDEHGQFMLETVDGRRLLFDPLTGRPASR